MQWDPPLVPQGVITHYTVQWQLPEPSDHFEELNGCSDERKLKHILIFFFHFSAQTGSRNIE